MLVHCVEAGEHLAEAFWTDGDHQREANGRVVGVAAANPVPELEHIPGIDAELLYFPGIGRDGDKVFRYGLLAAQRAHAPRAGGMRVGQSFQRCKGLGGDDKERLRGIQIARRLDEFAAVNVGDEAHGQGAVTVILQRFVGHPGTQVRAANADIDDVAYAPASVAGPGAAAHAVGEVRHLVEHSMHPGYDVLAIDNDALVLRRAQGDMQHGAPLGDVDLVAAKHSVDALAQARGLGQLQQQAQRFSGDTVL